MASHLEGLLVRGARRGGAVTAVFGGLALAGGIALLVGAGSTLGLIGAVLLAALGLFWSWIGARAWLGPWRDEAFAVFGAAREARLAGVAALEAELVGDDARVFGKAKEGVIVTRGWLVRTSESLAIVPLDELLWVYPKATSYSVNFVPLGTAQSYVVYTRSGGHSHMPLKLPVLPGRPPTETLLDVLQARAPRAFYGYRPEWAERWSSVRAAVIAERERQ